MICGYRDLKQEEVYSKRSNELLRFKYIPEGNFKKNITESQQIQSLTRYYQ